MPEYMTKCEPVDKKPYIVYTDEKGILYSGDPDSDIPGGGGGGTEYNIACYATGEGSPEPISSFVYKTKVQTEGDKQYLVPDGEPVTTATAGDCLITTTNIAISAVLPKFAQTAFAYPFGQTPSPDGGEAAAFIMPSHDVVVFKGTY